MAVSGRKALKNFATSISRGSGEDFEIFCQPCDRDDLRLPAFGFCVECEEHLCESCFNHHKRAKPSRHHTLLDKHNMPQSLQVPSVTDPHSVPEDLTKPCSTHKKEIIKFYCNDHNALLCSVCVTLKHPRSACDVDYIPDISGKTVDSKEYQKVIKNIDTMTTRNEDTVADLRKMTEKSNASLTNVLLEVKKFRKEINQRLDHLEHELDNTTKALKQNNNRRLKTAETSCDDINKDLQALSYTIKQLHASKKADRLFIELNTAKRLIQENGEKMSQLTKAEDYKEYHLEPNAEISALLENEISRGILKETSLKPVENPSVTINSKQYLHTGEVSVKTSQDEKVCRIVGMALLTPDKLIVADFNNESVKMIDINSFSIADRLKVEMRPWDVTTISEDKVAVTLPDLRLIQFVSVSSKKLARRETIKVEGSCFAIHCCQGQLIVSLQSIGKVQIIDLNGKVLKSIYTNSTGEQLFKGPWYLTANRSSIYVSDFKKGAVIQLNWQGEVAGTYSRFGVPAGLAILQDGSVLLGDARNHQIHNILDGCATGEVVLKNLKTPMSVCWCEVNRAVFISSYTKDTSIDNFIQIYKMA